MKMKGGFLHNLQKVFLSIPFLFSQSVGTVGLLSWPGCAPLSEAGDPS